MKRKTILKMLLGIFVFGLLVIILIPVFTWFAFGPIHSKGKLLLNENLIIAYDQTYTGDFAGEFYKVTFKGNDSTIGSYTFHNMNWDKHFVLDSLDDRIFFFFPDSNLSGQDMLGMYSLSFKKNFESSFDTIFPKYSKLQLEKAKSEIEKKY